MKLSTTENNGIVEIQSPVYPEMTNTLNAYLGLINVWDDESINSTKQVRMLGLGDHGNVIREIRINAKWDTIFTNVEKCLESLRDISAIKQVLIVQNEPNKDIYPGPREKTLARKIWSQAKYLGVPLMDQLVVSENSYYSYKENEVVGDE